jgi:hypothetical protein
MKMVLQSSLILLLLFIAYCQVWVLVAQHFLCSILIFFSYGKAGTVSCEFWSRVHQCAAENCAQAGSVHPGRDYPCDCFVIGQPNTDLHSKSPKWYRLNLPNGKYGYVNSFYCAGPVLRCWYVHIQLKLVAFFIIVCFSNIYFINNQEI